MAVTLAAVTKLADALPGVEVGARWGNKTWIVNGHGFAWQRPLSKADIGRFGDERVPSGDIVAMITDGLDAKDALLAMGMPGFFTIQHFNNYPALLVELALADLADVRAVLEVAHKVAADKKPKKAKHLKSTTVAKSATKRATSAKSAKKPATKTPAEKKPAEKKPATKKSATKKSATKKATKKPAKSAKKPAK